MEDYQKQIVEKLRKAGFNPVGIGMMGLEDTFIFETDEEATRANHQFERAENGRWIGEIEGWWYGREEAVKILAEYNEMYDENDTYPTSFIWLDSLEGGSK